MSRAICLKYWPLELAHGWMSDRRSVSSRPRVLHRYPIHESHPWTTGYVYARRTKARIMEILDDLLWIHLGLELVRGEICGLKLLPIFSQSVPSTFAACGCFVIFALLIHF